MRERRLEASVIALAVLVVGSIVGNGIWQRLSAPALTVLPALLWMAADIAGERPRPHAAPLVIAAGVLCVYMAITLRAGGLETYLPYALIAALTLTKAGLYPRSQGQRRAALFWSVALTACAVYAANPIGCGPERAEHLRSVWMLSVFPLLVSGALASTGHIRNVQRRPARAVLLLTAFILLMLVMSHLWYTWFANYFDGSGAENEFAGMTVWLYHQQPLLLYAILELFAPVWMCLIRASRSSERDKKQIMEEER